jgi:hypothetical protein
MLTRILEKDGITYYDSAYVEQQIKSAYRSGMFNGALIEFHSIEPIDEYGSNEVANSFVEKVNAEYTKLLGEGHVVSTYPKFIPRFKY